MRFCECHQFFFQQDIIGSFISKNKWNLCAVIVIESCFNYLINWCDSCATRDTSDLFFAWILILINGKLAVSIIFQVTQRPLHFNFISNFHFIDILTKDTFIFKVKCLIYFYQEIDISFLMHCTNWCILFAMHFSIRCCFSRHKCAKFNVAPDMKTQVWDLSGKPNLNM